MPKTLIVAEKPSVAKEIAKVLDVRGTRGDGFIANGQYVVTWAVGHLVNIAEPEEQNEDWAGRWSMNQLPMIPSRFKLAVLPKTTRQFEIVKRFMSADDVDTVVNATDAGREGELIFRRIFLMAGCTKPIKRLWANDMTEQGLKKALASMESGEAKRNLGLAAFARAEADWLIGMNYSRLFTLKDHSLVTVGRVQTPVLKLIVDRRQEIEHFVPRNYWTVEATLAHGEDSFSAQWYCPPERSESRIDKEEDAAAIVERCTDTQGAVESTKSRKGQQKPPLLFDLTTLQREANSRYGLSAKDTLAIAQALYEQKKLLTYPRTDSRYLTKDVFNECLAHMRAVYHEFPEITPLAAERIKDGKPKNFACVNDKKVSDHHAIIPTAKRPVKSALSENEWRIYEMVSRRFVAAFLPPVQYASSTIWVLIDEQPFKATGKVFKDKGWLVAEPWRTAKDNPLPALRKGSKVTAESLKAPSHQTKPPAHFTDASLLAAMETAGKLVEDDELREAMKERGLGTPATRAQIIETLLARSYVEKDKKKLVASDTGRHVIDVISQHLPDVTSPELTGDWEKKLGDIERGDFTYPEFMHEIRDSVYRNVRGIKNYQAYDKDGFPTAPPANPVAPVSDYRAGAPRPARQQYDRDGFPIASSAQPAATVQQGAGVAFYDDNGFPIESASSAPKPARKEKPLPTRVEHEGEVVGVCPSCGKNVLVHADAYICEADPSCPFRIPRDAFGGEITMNQAADLLSKGRTFKRGRFVSKKGKRFNAHLELDGSRVALRFKD